ncbi:hypothetical protein KXD40_005934 [Peronospora effusa]|uniref:WIBG Mago-binding domain-containing protein n=1 Tax=Peronospora effusa TaxID=542832 RepID=A0A3M6VMQ9_9STRA|nr:hypothetical protein DD238_001500 [Peronospora effusa]RQM16818.1 hypothetical protein DD237_002487 [Peronospora effusa]UIZ27535.1 hypothetical protein KXD40_005934 [Peronospora effusa]CAI5712169.1 unnamed protein product [Peronospora effusa]
MTKEEKKLPLGAVRATNGEVFVPASRRADGSTRKPIRIRQGYVPPDEVPKYKTVAQRRREQEAARSTKVKGGGDTAVEELLMDKLSLEQEMEAPAAKERPRSTEESKTHQDKAKIKRAETAVNATAEEAAGDYQQQLKRQLTKINKQLKEIAKLDDVEKALLSKQQKQTIVRKTELQQQRNEIIVELNGATITRSSNSVSGQRSKVAISL